VKWHRAVSRVSTIVRFFTFAIVDIYRKWVLISRNFAEFREIPKPRNSAKVRNFDIIDVGIPRNFEISLKTISEFRKISKDRCRYPRNCELSRNFDFVIIEISIFLGIPISIISIARNFAKTRCFDNNNIGIRNRNFEFFSDICRSCALMQQKDRYYVNLVKQHCVADLGQKSLIIAEID